MEALYSLPKHILWSEPSLHVQLLETLLIAGAFGIIMPASTRWFSENLKSRSWYDRTAAICRDMLQKMMKIEVTEAMLDKSMGQMIPLCTQHFVGGFLCAPSIFGLGVPREAAVAMARHGALIELGWELQDTMERLYERLSTSHGAITQPNGLFVMLLTHHALQWAMVIPMNLYYSELSGYHELIFMLEGASGLAGAAMFYGYTLDTTKRQDLERMVCLCAVGFAVMVYTRCIHYPWSVFKCLRHFYQEASYTMLAVGVICGCFVMPSFSLQILPEQWHKLMKFRKLYMAQYPSTHDERTLPALLTSLQHKLGADKKCVH